MSDWEIEDEADRVYEGYISIHDCVYPDEVMDVLGDADFDSRGYIIRHDLNYNYNNYENRDNPQKPKDYDKYICGCCLLLIVLWLLFCLISGY